MGRKNMGKRITTPKSVGSLRAVGALAACVMAIVGLAACGGGSGSSTGSGSTEESVEGSGSNAVVAAAEKVVAPYRMPATKIAATVPLSKKPPTGKSIVTLSPSLPVGHQWSEQATKAAEILGWTATNLYSDGAPEDISQKMEQAVSENPDGIVVSAFPRVAYEPALKKAEEQGIAVVTNLGETEGGPEGPLIAAQFTAPALTQLSEVTANVAIAESEGKADALIVQYAEFPIAELDAEVFAKTLKTKCPDCKSKTLVVAATDVGTKIPTEIVSELQSNPSINFLILQDASMVSGIYPALTEAGFAEKVKIIGNDTAEEPLQALEEGEVLGWMAWSQAGAAFEAIDALARHWTGDEQQENPLIAEFQTKESLPANPTPEDYILFPSSLEQEYKELWLVG
jgi:ribose transport system substrate-binding protein